jgi:hypothetical protein
MLCVMTSTNPELNVGPLPREAWPGLGASGWAEAPMTLPVGGRYQLRRQVGRRVWLAQDLWLRQPALLRPVGVVARLWPWGWRRRAQALAARRHPHWLNLYGPLRDGWAELMATDCPRGPSLEALLREGVRFSLKDVVELLPLTALDLAAAVTGSPDGPRLGGVFIEPRDGSVSPDELRRQPPSDWPPFVTRLDAWDLARPATAWRESWRARGGSRGAMGARYAALLTYGLLAGAPGRAWGPVAQLSDEANGLLGAVLRGRRPFGSSEQFLAALERANRAGVPEAAAALAAPAVPGRAGLAGKRGVLAVPRASTVMAGAAALALVFAAVLYEQSRHAAARPDQKLSQLTPDSAIQESPARSTTPLFADGASGVHSGSAQPAIPAVMPFDMAGLTATPLPLDSAGENGPETADRVGRFMQTFLQSWSSGTGVSDVDFYADRARYDGREVSRSVIAREEAAYNARWPKRSFRLLGPPKVEVVSGSVHRVQLKVAFEVENANRHVRGEASYQVELAAVGNTFRVLGLDEQITKRVSHPKGRP